MKQIFLPLQNINKSCSTKVNVFGLNFEPKVFLTHFCLYFVTDEVTPLKMEIC
jgi:hypothetical protein